MITVNSGENMVEMASFNNRLSVVLSWEHCCVNSVALDGDTELHNVCCG